MDNRDDARYRLTPKGIIWGAVFPYLKCDADPDTAVTEILIALRDAGYVIANSARDVDE